MQQTPFHAYYTARMLEAMPAEDWIVPVFSASDIKVYPFQVAAASFAQRSPYLKGAVLCDEAGMGKSHEAMLVIVQKWLEGQQRIMLAVPNGDLLIQWTELIDRYYTVPYVVLTNQAQWQEHASPENPNAFIQDAIILTTYTFAADNEDAAKAVSWDLTVFEEAGALSSAYQEGSKQGKALKRIAGSSFKLLLSGTPIEKNIMDLYGLIWFIDEAVLPDEQEFLKRYLRRPENYPELSDRVSKYCFRTLRAQAGQYAKVTRRVLLTYEYAPSAPEQELYDLLYAYVNQPEKLAFPEMDPYELALRLLGLQSSSTAAILQTIRGVIRRLEGMAGAETELDQWRQMEAAAEIITRDAKVDALLKALKLGFALMKKSGARKKAVIFTESTETQKMLYALLREQYRTLCYHGGADYSVIRQFKQDGEVLISTDNGAKGFDLEAAAFVIHYDLLYNTLKMEQRIDRCHRLDQENDVLSLAFINQANFADVRKLELVSKRMLVSGGVFGVSDEVLGGFADDLDAAFASAAERLRTRAQVEADYQETLKRHETENRQIVSVAEDVLFTTFTRELADKVKLSPRYISDRAGELNDALWNVANWFFSRYNESHEDGRFEIDEQSKSITLTGAQDKPVLFYYWSGSRSKPYRSLARYGMGADFKPRSGQITLSSVIGRGVLQEVECAPGGTLTVDGDVEPCTLALYTVTLSAGSMRRETPVLCGRTDSGRVLTDKECRELLALPVLGFTEEGSPSPHWLKRGGKPDAMDQLVPVEALVRQEAEKRTPAQTEEIEQMKLRANAQKAALPRALAELEARVKATEEELESVTGDRLQRLALEKKVNALRRELLRGQESQFFDAMRLDLELEEQIKAFAEKEKVTAGLSREFMVQVNRCR